MTPGEPVHVVYTYSDPNEDGVANLQLYVNGELNASANNASGYPLNTIAPLQIGATAGGIGITGVIDDFQIYERVLLPEHVDHIYQKPGERAPFVAVPILLGYWPFDDQSVSTADVQAGNNGTVNGNAGFVAGHSGAAGDFAIEFDGVDDSVTTEVPLLDDQGIYSITGWVNLADSQADRTGLFGQNDLVEFGINGVTMSAWTVGEGTLAATQSLPIGEWVHVATVSGETERMLYINGQEVGTGAADPDNRGVAGFNFNIGGGGIWDADGDWFAGQIDDVAVFSVALTPGEIAALASGTLTPLQLQEGAAPPFDDGVLVNGSFEDPAVDNIDTNNLGVVPTGWSQTGADETWNVIRNDGSDYDNGVNTAAADSQVLDLNGVFEIFQNFTLTEFSDVTFGASFANRAGHDGSAASMVGIYDASGTTLLSSEVSVDTSGDPQPSETWRSGEGTVTGLAPGEYQIRVALNNWNNVDAVYARATPGTYSSRAEIGGLLAGR